VSPALWAGMAILGGLGSVARLLVERGVARQLDLAFPTGTVAVNVSGALLLGIISGWAPGHSWAILAGVGFLGAYTTFSGWMLETRSLTEHRRFHAATVNIVLSVVLGLAAAAAGQWLGRLL